MRHAALGLAALLACSTASAHENLPFAGAADSPHTPAPAGSRPEQPAGQTLPLETTRTIAFETDAGTWMSVDVAPDGQTIAFDLLGDLYVLGTAGGRATPITRGLGFDAQPTYSPDGRWIAFVSDRSGAENLWLVRPDGSDARQITFGDDDSVLVSPAWTPVGKALYASRFLWSVNNYELWRFGLDGSAELVAPIKGDDRSHDRGGQSSLGAAVAPDGTSVYFARRHGDPDEGMWTIVRRAIESGAEETVVPDPPGPGRPSRAIRGFRPLLSPDGTQLAYATRYGGETGLKIRELAGGSERWLAFPIEHDQIDAQSWQDLVPRYDFTSDGEAIVLSRGGKLERLPLEAGPATPIPFTAVVEIELGPQTRVAIEHETGPVKARLIQTPEQSPDGREVVFSALGRLYRMRLEPDAKPEPLTQDATPAFHPSWSPDGRQIVYVTWTEREAGQVWIVPARGGSARRLSTEPAFYTRPVFTPDGRSILAVRSNARGRLENVMDFEGVRAAELVEWSLAKRGEPRVIHSGRLGGKPHFSVGGVHLEGEGGRRRGGGRGRPPHGSPHTLTIDLATGDADSSAPVLGPGWYFIEGPVPVDNLRVSPDGRHLLVQVAQQLHLLETPLPDEPIDLSEPGVPHRRITTVGADFFDWADDGRTIAWSIGSTFYRRARASISLNSADAPDWSADAPEIGTDTQAFEAPVFVPRDVPKGKLVLRGARCITMRGDEVIEQADVLIENDRIAAVGPRDSFAVPAGAEVRDVAGHTIVPGFIDIHDHVADIRRDVLARQSWGLRARLAYGVTTAFDPSSLSIDMFAYQDMVDAGLVIGARVPSTGPAMFSFNRIQSLDDARALASRYRDHYRTRNLKQYMIGNRRQREWMIEAAHELGMMPTTEGSLALKLDLSQIMDGYAGNEHALPTALYRDVIELVARSGTSYDATLSIKNGGQPAQDQFVIRDRPFADEKFRRTRPYSAAAAMLERDWVDPVALLYPRLGSDVASIQRAGGVVGIGSHGEIPGPDFHWELEAHVQGGMTPMEALHAGTIGSATAIGRAAEFGSIEPGKYADLVVLADDPRADIRATRSTVWVMKNGRLYDAATLDEIWPRQRPAPPAWFEDEVPTPR
jgi:Tol biopolymer transport system component